MLHVFHVKRSDFTIVFLQTESDNKKIPLHNKYIGIKICEEYIFLTEDTLLKRCLLGQT